MKYYYIIIFTIFSIILDSYLSVAYQHKTAINKTDTTGQTELVQNGNKNEITENRLNTDEKRNRKNSKMNDFEQPNIELEKQVGTELANKDTSKKSKLASDASNSQTIDEFDEFNVYINTSNTYAHITNKKNEKTQIVSFYNTSGEQVFQESFSGNTTSIDISHIPSGIYLLFLNNKVPKRIVISH